jgi:hypothetical protein
MGLRTLAVWFLAVFGFSAAGCATIMKGKTQAVGLSSNPAGATVTIDGWMKVSTPAVVQLSRNQPHTICSIKTASKMLL